MNKILPKQKYGSDRFSHKSPFRHFHRQVNQRLTYAAYFLTIGSLVWFSGCASNPMQFLERMSPPTSILDIPTSHKSSEIKTTQGPQTEPTPGPESKSSVSTASYNSEYQPTATARQDENVATPQTPITPPATTATPPSQEPVPMTQPTERVVGPQQDSLEHTPPIKIPGSVYPPPPFPKSSAEIPCDTGPDTDTDISLDSLALTQSQLPNINCDPQGFASTGVGMTPLLQGGTFLNGDEFRHDRRTATEIAIMLKDQNTKLKLEKSYLKDTAETLQKQLAAEQAARKLAETKFDEIQIENKDQRKVIAQLQLAYENLKSQKLEVEKEYDTKLREIEATLDQALLDAMYDANKKQ